MTHELDHVAIRDRRRAEERKLKLAEGAFKSDVQVAMANPSVRRVLWRFLQASNVDGSAFNTNGMAMGHNAGWQDAGRWWLEAIREHCPEQEAVMRNEARKEPPAEVIPSDE